MSLISYQQALQDGAFNNTVTDSHYLPAFSGRRMQRGSGGLSGVLKGFLKSVAPIAKKAAVSLGRNALTAGIGIANDALNKKDIKQSLKDNLINAGLGMNNDLLIDDTDSDQLL